jgi:hypothetical protein
VARKMSEYAKLERAVHDVISGTVIPNTDYRLNQQYGGKYDCQDRTFVGCSAGAKLRNMDRTKQVLVWAKAKLDADGRFGSALHYMRRAGDWVLIVQFGEMPVLG